MVKKSLKLLSCPFKHCNKTFPCNSKLNDHVNTHYNYRPYSCQICNNAYCSKKALDVHLKTHSNTPWMCDKCHHPFKHKHSLTRHNCEQRYTCRLCNKIYIRKKSLLNHISAKHTHSKNNHILDLATEPCKPKHLQKFTCMYCHKEFKTKKYAQEHINNIHKLRKHICKRCNKQYSHGSGLSRHKINCINYLFILFSHIICINL